MLRYAKFSSPNKTFMMGRAINYSIIIGEIGVNVVSRPTSR